MEFALSVEVCVVCVVVVWVVVALVSGVAGCWLGAVDDGEVDCCELASGVVDYGELGEVCATAQTADSKRIAVIKDVFLMCVPPGMFGLPDSGLEKSRSSALRSPIHSPVCLFDAAGWKKRELRKFERVIPGFCCNKNDDRTGLP
jgi:hypothetical protein